MAHEKWRVVHWCKHVIPLRTFFSQTNTQTKTTYKQWKNTTEHDLNQELLNQIDRALREFSPTRKQKLRALIASLIRKFYCAQFLLLETKSKYGRKGEFRNSQILFFYIIYDLIYNLPH